VTAPADLLARRSSGVLLHPTSLPGPGIGDLGAEAHRFVDWLADAGQTFWQVLPLVPVGEGGSPYDGLSAMAGNPMLVSPDALAEDGLLEKIEDPDAPPADGKVDFRAAGRWKELLLRRAYGAFRAGWAPALAQAFTEFRRRHAAWVDDFALFMALREEHGGAGWTQWEPAVRDRRADALEGARERLRDDVERHAFVQFLFERQWDALRRHANGRGVRIIGDVPIFVSHDSADVWANRELFELDAEGHPVVVSGVPPDYFSATGQRWGNPLYRWDVMRSRGYAWWKERFRRTLELVDVARIDHFRGFESYWEVPGHEETALNGRWMPGPGADLFRSLEAELGPLPLIAEDLGIITEEVEALRDGLELPGMRVLHFAFGDAEDAHLNPHLPANHPPRSVAYTGTHDNDTSVGWHAAAGEVEREGLERVAGPVESADDVHWRMMEAVFRSPAAVAIVPLQDVLGLGSEARMNTPGTVEGNWAWRFPAGALTSELGARLRALTRAAAREPEVAGPTQHTRQAP
jgi:4-alpha-glucanotransferase